MAQITLQEFARGLRKVRLRRAIEPELARLAAEAEAAGKQNATTRLKVRSGRLRSSVRARVKVVPGGVDMTLSAGSRRVPYARLQDRGGAAHARRGRYLAIPLDEVRTAAGVARYASARDYPGKTHIRRSRSGHLIIWDSATGRPLYLLKDRVKVPASRFLSDAFESSVRRSRRRIQDMADRFQEEIDGAR